LTSIVQNESGEFIFNLAVMSEEGNVRATWFGHSHENEGWVGFGGVGERDEFWFLGKLSGCDLCKQGLMGVDIFNGSTVDRVMGVGLVKITPNCIFGRDEEEG
jgi:hypothetical protein